eukprot:14602618-Alexandrium_andersonii.AAC.1
MVVQLVEGDDADPSLHHVTRQRWQLPVRHQNFHRCDLSVATDIDGDAGSLTWLGFHHVGYPASRRK